MPNGFHGDKDAWDKLEAPLRMLDERIDKYAAQHGLAVGRNYHSWPERSLAWADDIQRKVQVYMEADGASYAVGAAAWLDGEDGYFVRLETIIAASAIDTIASQLEELLESARTTANTWARGDLHKK